MTYHASKWIELQLLLDVDEMESLLQELGEFEIFQTGSLHAVGEEVIDKSIFLKVYRDYINQLKEGQLPEESFRPFFASTFSVDDEHFQIIHVKGDRQMIKVKRPVIQLQAHQMGYSKFDGKFRPMVFGRNSIVWGIQFSYPQLFQGDDFEVYKVDESFPNTVLFKKIQKWTRKNTTPTPFLVDEQQVNIPIRLGRRCIEWIHRHPQLKEFGIEVVYGD